MEKKKKKSKQCKTSGTAQREYSQPHFLPRQSQTQSTSNRKPEQRVEVKIKGQILYCSTHLKQSTYSTYNTPMISTSRYSLRKITMKICFSCRLRLQAATPTARCCGSSDHLLFFSRWLKPSILLRGGCKHRANQAVGNGLFWIANEAKLQRWSQTKNRGNRKNCFPSTAFKNLSCPSVSNHSSHVKTPSDFLSA